MTFTALTEILIELGIIDQPSDVSPSTRLDDIDRMDSLDHVELIMAIEDETDLDIPTADAQAWDTLADILAYTRA